MRKYTEIFKLKEMLEEAEIPFIFIDRIKREKILMNNIELESYQILIYENMREMMSDNELYPTFDDSKRVISIVQGIYTYGEEEDLLEIMGLLTEEEKQYDDVVGYLSAENVFNRITEYYKK